MYDKDRNRVDASTVDWSKMTENSFNYRITQTRSGATALGKVKFIFTNKHSIYFHDTPSKSLFKNDIRAYSHGCVRIHKPLNLATYLISNQSPGFTLDSAENLVGTRLQKRINIEYQMRVSIRYFGCAGSADGEIRFLRDIYNRETKVTSVIEDIFYSKSE